MESSRFARYGIGKTGSIGVVVVVVAIIAAASALYFVGGSNSVLAPKTATVSGSIVTSGSGTYATEILFTDISGATHSVQVSGGQFSISLANPGAYSIQVQWIGEYSWQSGTVGVSNPLNLNVGAGGSASVTDTITVPTPDAVISIIGAAYTTGSGTSAREVIFTSSYDIPYTAQITNDAYSISLPNDMNYRVQIYYYYSGFLGLGSGYNTCTASSSFNLNNQPGYDSGQAGTLSC